MAGLDDLFPLDATGPNGSCRTLRPLIVRDVSDRPVAALSLVPQAHVNRTMAALRSAPEMPAAELVAAIEHAGRIFAHETVAGLSPADYLHMVSRTAGLPLSVVTDAAHLVERAAADLSWSVRAGCPLGAVPDWRGIGIGSEGPLWCRRGDLLTVVAAGNHPAIHVFWLEALALGYRVVVRPSTREPFTPHRLVSALHAAGVDHDRLAFLPTTHAQVDQQLALADLSIVYGGDDVVRKYSAHPGVLVQGPGRAKILLTRDEPWEPHLDVVLDSITHHAGTACINTTAVLTEHNPAELADALASRLALHATLPPENPDATLPVAVEAAASSLAAFLRGKARGTRAVLGADDVVAPLGDGSAALRPSVHVVDHPRASQAGIELPFPCVWIAPWSPADGITPARGSLVLTVITKREDLIDAAVRDPTISNVHIGDLPTYWYRSGLPHDGYLSEFLMRSKAVARR
ncbi:aldehyde dehydrogenase family protein [Lentzea sp. E54]|uniref:aldehyde dehydrogenase family protein n=1 Tax=Lentzea xerophila TaxID=3435883 RepID=UPI003DA6845A